MKTFLITGCNRGIGLGLAKLVLQNGHRVIGTCRNPEGARDLWELEQDYGGRLQILTMDVADDTSVQKAAASLASDTTIDYLINNAGVLKPNDSSIHKLSVKDMDHTLRVNTLGPVRVTQAFLPFVLNADTPVIAHISSKVGSIADNQSGGSYGYRMSKTALNMFNKSLSLELAEAICVVLHPGWVKTDMGGSVAPTEIEDSVTGLYRVIMGLQTKDSGKFFDFRGEVIPW